MPSPSSPGSPSLSLTEGESKQRPFSNSRTAFFFAVLKRLLNQVWRGRGVYAAPLLSPRAVGHRETATPRRLTEPGRVQTLRRRTNRKPAWPRSTGVFFVSQIEARRVHLAAGCFLCPWAGVRCLHTFLGVLWCEASPSALATVCAWPAPAAFIMSTAGVHTEETRTCGDAWCCLCRCRCRHCCHCF